GSDWNKTQQLFKKYLSTTRQPYDSSIQMGSFSTSVQGSPTANSQTPPFHIKDGALLFLGTGEKYQVSPSSSGTITVDGCEMSKSLLGIITVDINGEEEPNTPYKDQFNFPISSNGIEYEMMCQEAESDEYVGVPSECSKYAQKYSDADYWEWYPEQNRCCGYIDGFYTYDCQPPNSFCDVWG
ncbi:MAG: hypothetical protein IJB79_07815, partial [Candidatus Gastranaerophilales bacterium]|nr:hypothetical protein [Candidatus Gastranaerophilales bacterium]